MLSEPPVAAEPPPLPAAPRRRRPWRGWLLFAAFLVALQFWQSREMIGGVMPPLAGTLADGRPGSLAATLATAPGEPALVYVWSAWCPVCKLQQPTIGGIAADWPVLTVAMQSGNVAEVAAFMAGRSLAYPALVDERGELAWSLGVRGVPAWFVVDGTQRIRFAGAGYTSGWGLRLRLWWTRVWR